MRGSNKHLELSETLSAKRLETEPSMLESQRSVAVKDTVESIAKGSFEEVHSQFNKRLTAIDY